MAMVVGGALVSGSAIVAATVAATAPVADVLPVHSARMFRSGVRRTFPCLLPKPHWRGEQQLP